MAGESAEAVAAANGVGDRVGRAGAEETDACGLR